MKNFKRTLALVLAVIMVVGMFASVSAAKNTAWYSEGVRYIEGIGVATIGNTADEKITRDEFVLWVAKIESGNVKDSYWTGAATTSFTDVTEENNQVAIKYSEMRGFIEGNGDGTFAPDKNITLGEAAAVIVRLMRYQSKVESNGENWAWAHMEVANEYCKAFTYDFRNNVGGGIYDYDYELTKGEAAYLLATVMNGLKEQVTYNVYNKPVYKSLTIDGHNLGEMFIGHTNVGAYGDVYMIDTIKFVDGEVNGRVYLTGLSNGKRFSLKADEFTSLVRVSLGLTAEKEEDEEEIIVEDTVKLGNLVDVTFDEDGDVVALEVNSGSIVVDTHIVQYGMLEGTGRLNWTANSLVTGASNSMPDHEATMNANWSSDLLFTWTLSKDKDEATLTFKGEEYDFATIGAGTRSENGVVVGYAGESVTGDLTVYQNVNNTLVKKTDRVYVDDINDVVDFTVEDLIDLIPTVAEGEVTLIFNDADNDGEYDTLIINEDANYFDVTTLQNYGDKTISYNYYYPGYMVDDETPSNKLELVVLASGRHYVVYEDANGKDVKVTNVAEDTDKDHVINEHLTKDEMKKLGIDGEWNDNTCGKDKCNLLAHHKDVGIAMNPYQRIELGTIQSGVIEESVLTTVGSDNYFRVKVKLAGGTYQTVYIPVPHFVDENNTNADLKEDTTAYTVTVDGKKYTLGEVLFNGGKNDNKVSKEAFYAEDKLTFEYTINGATAEVEFDWDYNEQVKFAYDALSLTGIEVEAGSKDYAKKAAKLVGQYISFMVDEDNVATYCVSGVAADGETGYLLDVEETDVENMYNVTIAIVDDDATSKTYGYVEDVEIYNVNATASTMFAGADKYNKITEIFNKGVVSDKDLGNNNLTINVENGDKDFTSKSQIKLDAAIDTLTAVTVKSNGTFSYIELLNTNGVEFDRDGIWNEYLNDENPDVVAGNDTNKFGKVSSSTGTKHSKGDYYPVTDNDNTITATTQYQGKFYSKPYYVYNSADEKWVLTVYTQTITLDYKFGVDSANVTASTILTLDDAALIAALVEDTNNAGTKVTEWKPYVTLHVDAKGVVRGVKAYAPATDFQRGTEIDMNGDEYVTVDGTVDTYKIAGEVAIVDGVVTVNYDFCGIDKTYTVTSAKITASFKKDSTTYKGSETVSGDEEGFYTFSGATASSDNVVAALIAVTEDIANTGDVDTTDVLTRTEYADVYAGTKALEIGYTVESVRTPVNASSSISNVTFTAMEAGTPGYIPGSYYFSIDAEPNAYYNTTSKAFIGYNEPEDMDGVTTMARQYRLTASSTVVLLTPSASGWNVEVMTPAEAAKLDLIIAGYSFTDNVPYTTTATYSAYNNKLETLVLIGQEALVETEKEDVVDDGKDVSEGEYLVYVPEDAETSLYAPEGSKTIKVISNKSVYAVPSGKEIGSIFYEYNAYTGAEMPTIKSVIASGWYLVEEDGEIIDKFDWTGKSETITVSVSKGKVVAEDADEAAVDVSKATLLYMDANGTLKKVSDADVTFASGSVFATAMKSATTALETAEANLAKFSNPDANYSEATIAKYEAAYEAAVVAYNEALAANIDKYFNGNIWDSFVTVAGNESAIQGAGEYDVTLYTVDDATFIIVNTWEMDGDVAVVTSAFN